MGDPEWGALGAIRPIEIFGAALGVGILNQIVIFKGDLYLPP